MTDLHFTGRVAKACFEEVAQICNTLRRTCGDHRRPDRQSRCIA